MESDEYEALPSASPWVQMVGGAFAGIMEHCLVYPIDSVKTRMQMLNVAGGAGGGSGGVTETLWRMVRHEGVLRPVRGMPAVVIGAGPAHAAYFTVYENLRDAVDRMHVVPRSLSPGLAGVVATLVHDAVMTPADAVKQRMQMYNSPYSSSWQCARSLHARHGAAVFYRAYAAQLAMNVPFQSIHFMVYEQARRVVNPERRYWPMAHMLCGAVAGAVAAAVTTPIDVCKTLLNTHEHAVPAGASPRARVVGLVAATCHVYEHGGVAGFARGLRARVVYQIPSTAICWTVYESMKYVLSAPSQHENMSEAAGASSVMTDANLTTTTAVTNNNNSSSSSGISLFCSGVVHTARAQSASEFGCTVTPTHGSTTVSCATDTPPVTSAVL